MSGLKSMNEILSRATSKLGLDALPPMRAGKIVCTQREIFVDYQRLVSAIRCFNGEGWVTYTDEVKELKSDELDWKRIALSGEWCNENESLSLRRSREGWELWTLATQESDVSWLSEVTQLKLPRGRLVYNVSWDLSADGMRVPGACRLIRVERE